MMNLNWFGTACAVAALAGFFVSYRRGERAARDRRILLAAAASILAIPGVSFAAYYLHLLPEPSWYYEFRSWRGVECLLILVGFAGGSVATLLPRRLLILPLFCTAAFVLAPVLKPLVGPVSAGGLKNTWDGDVCLQSTASTCGAAAVATILRSCGVTATEGEVARDAYSYAGGTEAWYLARAVRKRGCRARFFHSSGLNSNVPFPAVAGVRLNGDGHFIAVLAHQGDRFQIGDPLTGGEELSQQELLERYTFTGFYMHITTGK